MGISRSFIRFLGAAAVVVIADYFLVLTDCIIAGHVLGETALGAMNLLMPVFSAVTFCTWLLASGVSSIYAVAVRKKDEVRAGEIAGQGVVFALLLAAVIVGVLFCLEGAYLSFMAPGESITDFTGPYWTWYPLTVVFQSVGMMVLYLVFVRGGEPVCIRAYAVQILVNICISYGLCGRMGIAGISLGTAASYLVWIIALAVFLRWDDVGLRLVCSRLEPKLALRAVRMSFGESFVWLFHAILFLSIAKYILCFWDAESLTVCAVVFCIIRVTGFFGGISVALRSLESGSRSADSGSAEVERVFQIGAAAAFVTMLLAASLFFIVPEPLIGLFGIESFDLVDGAKLAARVTVGGLFFGGVVAFLPLLRRVRRPSVPEFRLSYLQSYVLSRMEETGDASQMFNLAKLFRLRKGVDLQRLSTALVTSGRSHGALRTVLAYDADGEIIQRQNLPSGAVRCPIVKMSEGELLAKKPSLVRAFDLFKGPLFEATIFDCGERAYLLSNFHHLICDGYSFLRILDDAHKVWDGETLAADDYYGVLKRRAERAAQSMAVAGRNFMREVLKGGTFVTLPKQDVCGKPGYGSLELPLDLPSGFEEFLSAHRVTRHHVFLAAAALALRRITDNGDVLIDWVFHGRVSKDELRTAGAFMVDLPLVFDGVDEMTASDVLAHVKRATFNGIKGVNVFRDVTDCNPTGQERLTFIYQDEWGELMSPGPVREDGPYAWMIEETIPLQAHSAATENPFNVEIMEHCDSTRLFIEYDTGRYSETTVRCYMECFSDSLNWLFGT